MNKIQRPKWIEKDSPADAIRKSINVGIDVSHGVRKIGGFLNRSVMIRDMPEHIKLITEEIYKFEPARPKLGLEYNYQLSLHQWLKHTFSSAVIERQKGSSRPDIVIDDVAIEVKGPTGARELETIASKIIRYRRHFKQMIIVLFELNVNRRHYDDWISGIKHDYPEIVVITK